jgi:hypothetical protein
LLLDIINDYRIGDGINYNKAESFQKHGALELQIMDHWTWHSIFVGAEVFPVIEARM